MNYSIRELRDMTGMTQKAFAALYGIPLSTFCKWEQGEASPPQYVVNLIAKTLPAADTALQKISGKDGVTYYYNKNSRTVSDAIGNEIQIEEDLEGVKEQNLLLYLGELFEDFYYIRDKFNRDCRFDKEDDVLWTR